MIKLCTSDDKCLLETYIGKNYPQCLYLYLNLKKYGLENDIIKCWFQEEKGKNTSVFLLYHTALHIFSAENIFDKDEILQFVKIWNPSIICASKQTIETLCDTLSAIGYIAEYGHVGKYVNNERESDVSVERATESDIGDIARLLYEDDDIGASYTYDDLVLQIRERLSEGYVRSWVIKDKGKVVAHLGTGAEIDNVCTISYAITAPQYRGLGFASRMFKVACQELTAEGKEIYSIYYPENSRRLHHKMGFIDYCECGKLFLKKH